MYKPDELPITNMPNNRAIFTSHHQTNTKMARCDYRFCAPAVVVRSAAYEFEKTGNIRMAIGAGT
jgi:hypothetical protein